MTFLTHIVSKDMLMLDLTKIKAVRDGPRTKNVLEIRSFLGLAGYYRNFVEWFSRIATPLIEQTHKNSNFFWSDRCENSFQELKGRLITAPVLNLPPDRENYQPMIGVDSYEMLYGRKCRSPIHLDEMSERKYLGPEAVQRTNEAIEKIRDRILASQSRQKNYADRKRRNMEF
ncbi:uncharacterized mitochondrial protein AtMg00860-like [Humulus lupulus]|uniref:uncharacterized mitochondrial protein AtMg00860-like n=1 Tax=Humulus lupulus TaxID=3486 RepID=UPI002B412624|nr:uncharacterized mitochondrial protein AtMg00860-like [Humulus lupulus]